LASLSFVSASDHRLMLAGAPTVTATPFSVAGWVRPGVVTTQQTIFYAGTRHATAGNDSYRLLVQSTGSLGANTRNAAGTGGVANSTATMTANTWYHAGAAFYTGRKVALNGVINSSSTTITPSATTALGFGVTPVGASVYGTSFDGRLENWAFWNVELTGTEFAALAKGAQPCDVRPGALVYWWRNMGTLVAGQTTVRDWMGTEALAITGATASAEAPVQQAQRPRMRAPISAVTVVTAKPRIVVMI
jgi:hypothetical protein